MIHMLFALYLSLNAVPVITLERTQCFGPCPVYKVTIYDDGKVEYEGKEFVKVKGSAQGQITKEAVHELIRDFEKINYFKLDEGYGEEFNNCPELWTDYPTAITSLKLRDDKKTVRHYLGCRGSRVLDQLVELENKIDRVVNTERWIRSNSFLGDRQ
jgi:hypothetical protein